MTREGQITLDAWLRAGVVLFLLVGSIGGFWYIFHAAFSHQPTAAERFGCAKTFINARGEDTGECQ